MNWNWFPLDAGAAIQSAMRRRILLDSIRIGYQNRIAQDGYIEDLSWFQTRLVSAAAGEWTEPLR